MAIADQTLAYSKCETVGEQGDLGLVMLKKKMVGMQSVLTMVCFTGSFVLPNSGFSLQVSVCDVPGQPETSDTGIENASKNAMVFGSMACDAPGQPETWDSGIENDLKNTMVLGSTVRDVPGQPEIWDSGIGENVSKNAVFLGSAIECEPGVFAATWPAALLAANAATLPGRGDAPSPVARPPWESRCFQLFGDTEGGMLAAVTAAIFWFLGIHMTELAFAGLLLGRSVGCAASSMLEASAERGSGEDAEVAGSGSLAENDSEEIMDSGRVGAPGTGPASSSEDPWSNWRPGAWEDEWETVQVEEYKFDLEKEAKQRGLNVTELFYYVFEYGIEEGLKQCYIWQAAFDAAMLRFDQELEEGDASEVDFKGEVLAEVPFPAEPEPIEKMKILMKGPGGLGVWQVGLGESLAGWHERIGLNSGDSGQKGYFTTIGGKILDPKVPIKGLGLVDGMEVVYHGRLRGGGYGGMARGAWEGADRQYRGSGHAPRAGPLGAGRSKHYLLPVWDSTE